LETVGWKYTETCNQPCGALGLQQSIGRQQESSGSKTGTRFAKFGCDLAGSVLKPNERPQSGSFLFRHVYAVRLRSCLPLPLHLHFRRPRQQTIHIHFRIPKVEVPCVARVTPALDTLCLKHCLYNLLSPLRVPPVIIIAPFLRRISEILLCDMIQEIIPLSFRAHFEFFTLH
jgi:hypothetical protein